MIARNPKDYNDRWLVDEAYFNDNLEPLKKSLLSEIFSGNDSGKEEVGEPDRETTWEERVVAEKFTFTYRTT